MLKLKRKIKKITKKQAKKPVNKGGRPPIYKTADELQAKITDFFTNCPDKRVVTTIAGNIEVPTITITGLVLHLGFCDRSSFYDLERSPRFSYTIKKARSFIEREYEMCLKAGNCTGAIFALKNFGWKDQPPVALTVDNSKHTHYTKVDLTGKTEQELTDILLGRTSGRKPTQIPSQPTV